MKTVSVPLASLVVVGVLSGLPLHAAEPIPFAKVAPLFKTHCQKCHDSNDPKPKGGLRIDRLNPDLIQGKDGDHWQEVLNRLNFGDMPPKESPPLAKADRELMTGWIVQELRRAALTKNPITHFRRLTRKEYERTLQDLLGLNIEFGRRLPEDGRSKEGFRNDGDALRMSPLQYEMYLQIAEEALAEAIVTGPAPEVHRYRLEAKKAPVVLPQPENRPGESYDYKAKGKTFTIGDDCVSGKDPKEAQSVGVLLPAAPQPFGEAALKKPDSRYGFRLHHPFRRGEMLIRVRVARIEPEAGAQQPTRLPLLAVGVGCTNLHGIEIKTVAEPIVINHSDFRTYEFRARLENFPLPNPGSFRDQNCSIVYAWNAAPMSKEPNPPKLKVEWMELESPFYEQWPPESHTRILFPNTEKLPETEYAREVIRRFAQRAFRGPVEKSELDRLMAFWTEARKEADSFEASIRETLSLVLTSTRFLALPTKRSGNGKERLTDYELASRLSYFLWSTMPDETLLQLAQQGKLQDPKILAEQTRRMIRDSRASQFIEQFTEQWLELDRLQRVTVNKGRYPEFNDQLTTAMKQETIHFVGHLLRENLSIVNFLDADFTFVNETLAKHYGIAEVQGPQFRLVKLDPKLNRGGLLTQASILTGTSDGLDGHPTKRGMWLLKNLLDDPPPPPPPAVPELDRANDPKLKGLSIKEALAIHRSSVSCNGCHSKIDPWGIAFEEYDALGNLRKSKGAKNIDAKAELPSGVTVDGMVELKKELLRTRTDDLRKAVLHKVASYALGRSLTLTDLDAIDALVPALKKQEDRFANLVELIVTSETFLTK